VSKCGSHTSICTCTSKGTDGRRGQEKGAGDKKGSGGVDRRIRRGGDKSGYGGEVNKIKCIGSHFFPHTRVDTFDFTSSQWEEKAGDGKEGEPEEEEEGEEEEEERSR
jgi:hypothetical protein